MTRGKKNRLYRNRIDVRQGTKWLSGVRAKAVSVHRERVGNQDLVYYFLPNGNVWVCSDTRL